MQSGADANTLARRARDLIDRGFERLFEDRASDFAMIARIEDRYLCMPETPGLGLELNEDAVRKFAL